MEALLRRSPAVPQERRTGCSAGGDQEDADDRITTDEQLQSTRTEMGEVKQENERLKTSLAQIMKDYQSLQRRYFGTIKQHRSSTTHQQTDDYSELVSLSLQGRTSSGRHMVMEEKAATVVRPGKAGCRDREEEQMKGVLSLGLEQYCRFDVGSCSESQAKASPESSSEETKVEGDHTPAGKVFTKTTVKSEEGGGGDASELISAVKRARVSVRARCDAPTMSDGCQWRKYGQKISKGNPRPRAYYRCTVAPSCPVRKQVQRCAEDMSILITTYEGTHNHPLPISATAMASATSAAASMLMSGSTSASHHPVTGGGGGASSSTGDHYAAASGGTTAGLHHALKYFDVSRQFYPPINPSAISPSPSCPTITLDLTATAPSSSVLHPPNSCGLTLGSTSQPSNATTVPPAPWSSAGYLNYYTTHPYLNTKSLQIGFSDRSPHQEPFYSSTASSMQQKATQPAPLAGADHGHLTDTAAAAAAAAKVITSDPSFQSAVAAAIRSVLGGNNIVGGGLGVAEPPMPRRDPAAGWEEKKLVSTFSHFAPPNSNGGINNGCTASSFLTSWSTSPSRTSENSQQATALAMSPRASLAITSSKSTSASPCRDHAK